MDPDQVALDSAAQQAIVSFTCLQGNRGGLSYNWLNVVQTISFGHRPNH